MFVGQRIRSARKAAGLTQLELAESVGCSEPAIRLYELGKRTPKPEMLNRIAKALGVDSQSLCEVKLESSRDALELLFRLEDACGLTPEKDGSLSFDRKTEDAKKMRVAIKQWAQMRNDLNEGKITQEEYDAWKSRVN